MREGLTVDREKRIRDLAEHLIWAINQTYNESELIQDALARIEEEGYRVDILLAAFTRIDRIDAEDPPTEQIALITQAEEDEEDLEEDPEDPLNPPPSIEEEPTALWTESDRQFLKIIKVAYVDGD